MRISLKYLAPLAVLALVGCQTVPYQPYARLVKKKPGAGGVIAVTMAHRDEDMPKATEMMAQNCGTNPSKVTEEGEVVVGTTTVSNAQETHNAGSEGHPVVTFRSRWSARC